MKAPKNRRVFVIGYGAATPLGLDFARTWQRAVNGEAGFRKVTRCAVKTNADVVGEIPDWDPEGFDFTSQKGSLQLERRIRDAHHGRVQRGA